jgi:CheY-like chemotaxis protein
MGDVLRLAGHEVQVAYEGRTGVELARTFHPDVVLCDLGLPDVDGYAVAHALRADASCRDVYLIAVSGYRRQEDVERARRAGFDEHLAKPARLEEVARLMAQAHVHPLDRQEEHP